ncbi:arginine--tRNA ligase [Desulfothermus naphthae]
MNASFFVEKLLHKAVESFGASVPERVQIEPPREKKFGDIATNIAMLLSKELKDSPRNIAEKIKDFILNNHSEFIEKIDIAGPGFLNFTLSKSFWQKEILEILNKEEKYGQCDFGKGKKVLIEYVSANPTGPLHVGHGRGAAVGDSLSRILKFAGFDVSTEYYINDAGRQIKILGKSIYVRYKQLLGFDDQLDEDSYKGEYIIDIAKLLMEKYGKDLLNLPEDEAMNICSDFGKDIILQQIKEDLKKFRVSHDLWFSEKSLIMDGAVENAFSALKDKELIYEKDGALWFSSTKFGDDKDRVLKKSNGDLTYFASDIAYHKNKLDRGFELLIDIWGADHHGYIPRMKAAIEALARDREDLQVILIQLVNLVRGGKQVSMSTRAGEFVTLAQVIDEVGVDAARFIFLSRKSDSHLDFDLDLAKQKTMENPVYYCQYAHARICSVFSKAKERNIQLNIAPEKIIAKLNQEEEIEILKKLNEFQDIIMTCARLLSPHILTFYVIDLAGLFHKYYNKYPILGAKDDMVIKARLYLLKAVRQVLQTSLCLLGVSAPERM